MKRIKNFLFMFALVSCLFVANVLAANLTVSETGWKNVGESQVKIGSLNIANATATFNGNFAKRVTATYSDADYASGGKFDQERNSAVSYNDTGDDINVIVYKNALSAGTHSNLGSMTLKWTGAAKDADGNVLDVIMNVSNITIKNNRDSTKPIELFANDSSNHLWMAARYAKEEVAASNLSENHKITYNDLGVKYDISFEFTKTGTSTVVNKYIVLNFSDLDQPDNISGDFSGEYTEGITLLSGVSGSVYIDSDSKPNYLAVSNTSAGNNTRFTGKQSTSGDESLKAGFSVRVNSNKFELTWTGSGCGTMMGFMGTKTVTTSTSGTYKNNVTITPTDKEVLWKEDKKIEIKPDTGYQLSKVTVDGSSVSISSLTNNNGTYTYTFNDVIENHTIDVQVTKVPHTLLVHHYKEGTTTKLGNDVSSTKYYGDSYTTSALSPIPEGYELIGTSSRTGTMPNSDLTITYYYKLKEYTLTVHHYEEGTTNKLAPDVVSTKNYGDSYTTSVSSSIPSDYEYVSKSDNSEGTIKKNEEVIYYYKKKRGKVITHHYIDGTTTKLAADVTNEYNYGDTYETTASNSIPQNYILKTTPDNYRDVVNKPSTEVIYYYQKKDGKIVPTINKNGTQQITSSSDKISYKIIYKTDFTDLIENGTVTIVDTLPYKIDVNNSNLDGGTYDDNNKTITWNENISINSYNEPSKTFEKNIEVKYLNINPSGDVIVNKVKGTVTIPDKTIDINTTFNTLININGKITEQYIDKETGSPIIPDESSTKKVGTAFTPDEKEFEGYVLVTKPEDKNYKYEESPQTLTYKYEKIKLYVTTKVNGTGGTIEGDEIVLYGDNSTENKIKIKADNGYTISKILINGNEIEIPKNSESMTLSNFIKMTENKIVEVSFEAKPIVVNAPKTDSNIPLLIIILGIIFISIPLYYFYNNGKLSSLFKINR